MKRYIAVILTAFLFAISIVPAMAAENPVIREYTFQTNNKDFNYTDHSTIEVEGQTYEAVDTKYEIIEETSEISKTESFTGLTEKKVPETITAEDGTELKLQDVNYTERKVSTVQTYQNYVVMPSIPDSVNFESEGKTVKGVRTNTQRTLSAAYNVPFTISSKYYGDEDCMYYLLDEKKIPSSTAPEFSKYQEELLAYLKLDPDIYRIDSGKWSSDYYKDGDQTVREATYSGMQRSNTYSVTYEGILYDAKATYANGMDDDVLYTVKAIVEYTESGLSTIQKVLLTFGIALAVVVIIVAILYYLKEKQEKNNYGRLR